MRHLPRRLVFAAVVVIAFLAGGLVARATFTVSGNWTPAPRRVRFIPGPTGGAPTGNAYWLTVVVTPPTAGSPPREVEFRVTPLVAMGASHVFDKDGTDLGLATDFDAGYVTSTIVNAYTRLNALADGVCNESRCNQ